jgi:protein-glucosylgalactosylhydroxylysine glucosidase
MASPISPPPATEAGRPELPAYVSNGLIGLRVLDVPLLPGVCVVSGASGIHPVIDIEAAANPPYPLAGDIRLDRVWLSLAPHLAEFVDQAYDFSCGELTTRFVFRANGVTANVSVLTFCSRADPTVVAQEVRVEVDRSCDLVLRSMVEARRVAGRITRRHSEWPGTRRPIDGSLCWESLGGLTKVGFGHATELLTGRAFERSVQEWGRDSSLATDYHLRAEAGEPYRLRQLVSLVPSELHHDPDLQAARLVGRAQDGGFEQVRTANRQEWQELWRGRIGIVADDDRWQRLADAAFFYLNTSVHRASPSSTSIFGLAQWVDYHYYHGLVMWDIETFCVPPLVLLQPSAARALLEFRSRTASAARGNAKMLGRRGLQFSWESSPLFGEESMPVPGFAAIYEDHGSLDIAVAFSQLAHASGSEEYLRYVAAPILYGVADWVTSRVEHVRGGYRFPRTLGIAERKVTVDDDAYTVMAAKVVLREATAFARRLGDTPSPDWSAVESGLRLPVSRTDRILVSHAGYRRNEEKGATPDPLAGFFPLWFDVEPELMARTIRFYLDLAPGYIGSPMLSSLYGVWAAWLGDRAASLRLFEQGYADMIIGRFSQTMEHTIENSPNVAPAGPFAANIGGFLSGLLFGLPGIRIGAGDPGKDWPVRPVVLPAGWRRIEVERAWVHGRPARIVAEHGAERSILDVASPARAGATYPIPEIARL